jgi:hypothetical protein
MSLIFYVFNNLFYRDAGEDEIKEYLGSHPDEVNNSDADVLFLWISFLFQFLFWNSFSDLQG